MDNETPAELGESYDPDYIAPRKFSQLLEASVREKERELNYRYTHHLIWHCPVGHGVDHEFAACIEAHPCNCSTSHDTMRGLVEALTGETDSKSESISSSKSSSKTESDHIHDVNGCDHR